MRLIPNSEEDDEKLEIGMRKWEFAVKTESPFSAATLKQSAPRVKRSSKFSKWVARAYWT
jgi:hypothetical protein